MRRNEMRVEWDRVERGRESKVTRIVHVIVCIHTYLPCSGTIFILLYPGL